MDLEKYTICPNDYQVMIIDDEDIIRQVTEEGLASLGYKVVSFNKPENAINYYRKNFQYIDFIIIDMIMPNINGAETFYRLQKINPFVLAVVLSGYDNVEKEYQYLLMDGLKGFLKKPISMNALDNKIREILLKYFSFNIEAGLSTLLNNKNIYFKVLETYYQENKNLSNIILSNLENNNFNEIELLVHKIKGISLNLGANYLYKLSFELNRHLKDKEYDITEIFNFIKYHNILIKDLERLLGAVNVQ